MKRNEKTLLGKLEPGDVFTMTPGGIHLVKGIKKDLGSIYVPCFINKSKISQSLTDNFPVYFIQKGVKIKTPGSAGSFQVKLLF